MKKNRKPRVGDIVYPWWKPEGARVLAVLPYTGIYPQWFSCVLRIEAPTTMAGWVEMAWNKNELTNREPPVK